MASINERINEIKIQIKVKQREIDVLSKQIAVVQAECEHRNKYKHTDYGGDTDTYCRDCGEINPY